MTVTKMVEREEEEDKKKYNKRVSFIQTSGVVLERENKFFLGRKEGNSKLIGGEIEWFFFGRKLSFSIGRTKVGVTPRHIP